MHIRQLRIQNIACFDDITLDFTDEKGKPCKWVVLLGENGTGKSTALQILKMLLPSDAPWPRAIVPVPTRNWVRDGQSKGSFVANVGSDARDTNHPIKYSNGAHVEKNANVTSINLTIWMQREAETGSATIPTDTGWFAAGYRPEAGRYRPLESVSSADMSPREDRYASLCYDYGKLTSVRLWLADLDYARLKEVEAGIKGGPSEVLFEVAKRSLESVFPNETTKFVEVTPSKDVVFMQDGLRVSIDMLSDGYLSAMNWVGDLVRRLVEAFPTNKDPLHAHGVVLVDEIDLHLHPRWQRSIVSQIRKVFPNLQFIVTTHSPFIVQEMTEKDKIIVLRRNGDRVTVIDDDWYVQGWRVDQILTSRLFGLRDTRGRVVEEEQQRQRALLDQRGQNGLSPEENETLKKANDFLACLKSRPEEHIDDGLADNGDVDKELRRTTGDLLEILAKRNAETAKLK